MPGILCCIPAIFVERKERRGSLVMYLLSIVSGEGREGEGRERGGRDEEEKGEGRAVLGTLSP